MPFISFEGIDGSGKTIQSGRLATHLRKIGCEVIETNEPDGGLIGQEVRKILVTERAAPLSSLEEMLLISAARTSHVRNLIRPALEAGHWVISDRFIDSTYGYQVHDTDVAEKLYLDISQAVTGQTLPDLTFILDIPLAMARDRRSGRTDSAQQDPAEATRNFGRIREGLLAAAKRNPSRCRIIDASLEITEVEHQIHAELEASGLFQTKPLL